MTNQNVLHFKTEGVRLECSPSISNNSARSGIIIALHSVHSPSHPQDYLRAQPLIILHCLCVGSNHSRDPGLKSQDIDRPPMCRAIMWPGGENATWMPV